MDDGGIMIQSKKWEVENKECRQGLKIEAEQSRIYIDLVKKQAT